MSEVSEGPEMKESFAGCAHGLSISPYLALLQDFLAYPKSSKVQDPIQ